jgi:sulfatase maturation enzyme AslB (radical SAM superfamily)
MKQLILIVNDTCTLKCPYCLLRFGRRSMDARTARAALSSYLSGPDDEVTIKLSGGEPLIGFSKTRRLILLARRIARQKKKKIRFQLCTNAVFLKAAYVRFLTAPDIDLSVSLGIPERPDDVKNRPFQQALSSILKISKKRPLIVNTVITPGRAAFFYGHFLYLADKGFRRFHFLPAYYTRWTKGQLESLKSGFRQIIQHLRTKEDRRFFIKNAQSHSRTPLFNDGVVVDCQGDVYLNNFFLIRGFEKLARRLKIGNVHKGILLKKPLDAYQPDLKTLRPYLAKSIYASTCSADRILTGFTNDLCPSHEAL